MRMLAPIAFAILTSATPAFAQLINGGVPGVASGAAGGTSAAIGGGTMGPYTGSVMGGTSSAIAGGTMGPATGGGFNGLSTGSGYQLGPLGTIAPPVNANNGTFTSGLNAGSLSTYNAGTPSLANPGFANQSPIQPMRFDAPTITNPVPNISPVNPLTAPLTAQPGPNTFSTTQSPGFAIPVPGINSTGTITNVGATPAAP